MCDSYMNVTQGGPGKLVKNTNEQTALLQQKIIYKEDNHNSIKLCQVQEKFFASKPGYHTLLELFLLYREKYLSKFLYC